MLSLTNILRVFFLFFLIVNLSSVTEAARSIKRAGVNGSVLQRRVASHFRDDQLFTPQRAVCQITVNGTNVQLGSLTKTTGSDYTISANGIYYLNICAQVLNPQCLTNTGSCQQTALGAYINIGSLPAVSGKYGNQLLYENGQPGCNSKYRQSYITFVCDNTVMGKITAVTESPGCTYTYTFNTKLACA